jgi:RHS repeat-associated protein
VYDNLDRLINTIDPLSHTNSSSYDTESNIISKTDELGHTTTYSYDADNRRIKSTDALGGHRMIAYDAVGNIGSNTDELGRTTTYTYDALDRQTAITDALGHATTYTYDALGNRIQATDALGQITQYVYDSLDRQIKATDAKNQTTNTSYDAVGNMLSITDAVGNITTYTYDALNRQLTDTNSLGKTRSYGYDAVGNLILSIDRNSRQRTYTYDVLNRETAEHWLDTASNDIRTFNYNYDAVDRITQSSGTDGTQNYSYDSTNQLVSANHTTQTNEAYSYDANGNRTNAGYGTGTNNQLLTDGIYSYQYDGEGNRTRRVEISTGKITEYVWDYRSRLASVLFKDIAGTVTKTIDYTYDVNNQRIGKRIDGAVTERYVYDGQNIALVFDGAGNQTHRYLYGTGVDTVLADERGGTAIWALADNQGTIKDVLDGNGAILNHINYDSFGKVISQSNVNVEFHYGYTGRETDKETGLNYYRARYYDASNGRFISEDPLEFGAGDSNLNRYVFNNPVNAIDPSGLQSSNAWGNWDPIGDATKALIVGTGAALVWTGKKLLDAADGGAISPGAIPQNKKPTAILNPAPKRKTTTDISTDTEVEQGKDRLPYVPNPSNCKTCATDPKLNKYTKYETIVGRKNGMFTGYEFIKTTVPRTGLTAALQKIKNIREGKASQIESSKNIKKERNAYDWWREPITLDNKGRPSQRDASCPYPSAYAKHYNVLLKYESRRSNYSGSSSVGSIGRCLACQDQPTGPKLLAVYAVLNIKNNFGKPIMF